MDRKNSIIYNLRLLTGIFSVLISLSFLFACSDDLSLKDGLLYEDEEGIININFSVPEADHIVTRISEIDNDLGDERKLNEVTILIFNRTGKLLQREDIKEFSGYHPSQQNKNSFSYRLTLNSDAKAESNRKIYAIANNKSIIKEGDNYIDLLKDFTENGRGEFADLQTLTSQYYKDHYNTGAFLMSGELKGKTINLRRTAAKITLKDHSKGTVIAFDEDTKEKGYSVYDVYNTANSGFVIAALLETPYCNNRQKEKERSTRIEFKEDNSYRWDSYVHPTETSVDGEIKTFVVFKAIFNEKPGYYALTLKDSNGTPLDILPNYWYEIQLKSVEVEGYSTPEEAMQHPFSPSNSQEAGVQYQIHDHAPEILSMISDGVHELGVTPEVNLFASNQDESSPNNDNSIVSGYFIIKCYSADENEEEFSKSDLLVELEENNWLEIDNGEKYTEDLDKETTEDREETEIHTPTRGVKYKYTVSTTRQIYSDVSAKIKVSWKGLEREVIVNFDSKRDLNELCCVTLTIKEEGSNALDKTSVIENEYWDFVAGLGTSKNSETGTSYNPTNGGSATIPKLWGIDSKSMPPDKVRTQGFHFPMPYGKDPINAPWEYEYELDFNNSTLPLSSDLIYQYRITGDSFFKDNLVLEEGKESKVLKLYLKKGTPSTYNYYTGKLLLDVTVREITYHLSFDLYHTGFFHYENNSKYGYKDSEPKAEKGGYFYYEVIEMEGMHWLDRNIGAKSCMSYVSYQNNKDLGNQDAGGKYFTIGVPHENGTYSEPTIVEDMCPPGYRLPVTSEWNALRLSANFRTETRTTENGETYMLTFYDTENQQGEIYFQKGRFVNTPNIADEEVKSSDSPNAGDDASGYYWTRTEAPGMEKEQIGNWLRALYINGASTTFNNGSIKDHQMYIRCVAGTETTVPKQEEHYISFNVHDVTHVLLFSYNVSEDGKNLSSPLYTFPGKAVGTTASAKKWQNFACITSADLSNLYAIFVKLDETGKATIYKKSGETYVIAEKFSQDLLNPDDAWEIIQGEYYDFCENVKGKPNVYDKESDISEDCSGLPSDKFVKELDEEEILVNKDHRLVGYSDETKFYIKNEIINWTEVELGSVIKIYYSIDQDDYDIQACKNDWNKYAEKNSSRNSKVPNSTLRVIEIKINSNNLNQIKSDGQIIIQGKNCTLKGITIIPGDGTDDSGNSGQQPTKEPDVTNYIYQILWEGNHEQDTFDKGLQGLAYGKGDWVSKKENSVLRVYFTTEDRSNCVIQLRCDDDGWKSLPGVNDFNNPEGDYVFMVLTDEVLDKLINKKGLIITGKGFTVTRIVLYSPSN